MKDKITELEKLPTTTDIPIAKHYTLKQLPGLLQRYLAVGEKEYGLILSQGQVMRVLPPSKGGIIRYGVGWAVPGTAGHSAVRIWASDIHLRPSLFRVASGDESPVPLDAYLSAIVQVTDPARFYTTLAEGKAEYRASELADEIAASLDEVMQKQLLWYDAQTLCLDEGGAISARLAQELAPSAQDFLSSWGVALKSLSILSFRPSEMEDKLVQEVEALRGQVALGEVKTGALLEQVAASLQAEGLTTPEEIIKLKKAYAETPQQGQALLGQLLERLGQWREEQLQSRAAQLAIKEKPRFIGTNGKVATRRGRTWIALTIYSLLAIGIGGASAYLYWVRFSQFSNLDLAPGHVIAGASVLALLGVGLLVVIQVLIDRLLHFIISRIKETISVQRSQQPKPVAAEVEPSPAVEAQAQMQTKPAPMAKQPDRLEAWLTHDSLKTDEIIRRQVARELSQAITNLTEARHQALHQKLNDLAQSIKGISEKAEAFKTRVEGAAFYSSILPPGKGEAKVKAHQLITFEEDLWRQAQVFQLTSEKLLGSVQNNPAEVEPQAKSLASSLRQLEYHFSRRDGILEGVAVPRVETSK